MLLAQSPKKATFSFEGFDVYRIRAVVLQCGKEVGVELAGMVEVGQAVDHRDAAVLNEVFYDLVTEGADD